MDFIFSLPNLLEIKTLNNKMMLGSSYPQLMRILRLKGVILLENINTIYIYVMIPLFLLINESILQVSILCLYPRTDQF
jgi:hypothetical protein